MPDRAADTNHMRMFGALGQSNAPTLEEIQNADDRYWLNIAQQCHKSSTDFLDSGIRAQWEKNLAHFNSQHAKDSRLNGQNYKNRNRLFRPKTRAISIRGEAQAARALFSTADLTSVKATDGTDLKQLVSAEINQNLLQYRLTKTIPWFLTAMGAYQDTFNYGICISYQYWKFETRQIQVQTDALDEEGNDSYATEREIICDEPCIDLIEPENFRFDQAADWRDVVKTSPFLIRIVPMTVGMVEERMNSVDEKSNQPQWRQYTRQQIATASQRNDETESLRQARQSKSRKDPHDKTYLPTEFDTVYPRENIVREAGIDWVFWTLGHNLMLTDPVPIEDVYFHGKRPFRVGFSTIEAHKAIPAGKNELIAPIQESINKLTNQRFDNVDLVLNKRYFMRRGQNIDVAALMRNVPGGGVYMDNPETDIVVQNTPDVTSSSYEEHNRLSNEMDEVSGNFSTSSIQSNRAMNETVGGMNLNRTSSDEITEYSILVFIMTWVDPVLEQLLLLEQAYETDQVILKLAAGKSQMYRKFELSGDIPDQLLQQSLEVNVDVGIGNTDPTQKGDKFIKALDAAMKLVPGAAQRIVGDEALKELFGGAGRKDAAKFFKPEGEVEQQIDPATQALMEQNALKKLELEQKAMLETIRLENEDNQFYAKLAMEQQMTLEALYKNLGLNESKVKADIAKATMAEATKRGELEFKRASGRDGI